MPSGKGYLELQTLELVEISTTLLEPLILQRGSLGPAGKHSPRPQIQSVQVHDKSTGLDMLG